MLMTRMFSEMPGSPGRRQQIPRTIRSICTPAREAEQRAVIAVGSTSAFILAMIRAGSPASACRRSRSIRVIRRSASSVGATISFFQAWPCE